MNFTGSRIRIFGYPFITPYREDMMKRNKVMPSSIRKIEVMVLVCFFLSGITGLLYEILWTRMIVKIIGGAPFAVSIILTVFMGGLGLGAYLASKKIDRIQDPKKLVKIYGILELTIGAYALAIPTLLTVFLPLFSFLYNKFYSHFILYNLLTFLGICILLGIPLSVWEQRCLFCRFYVNRLSHLGTHGLLYGLNTIGAALGALVGGFWLIGLLGMTYTLLFAVVNCLIGLYCVFIIPRLSTSTTTSKGKVRDTEISLSDTGAVQAGPKASPEIITGALAIFAVSGFCAMAYEVIWTKLLGLVVGPTMYSFTIVLVTFILGLALGSLIFGWIADKVKEPIWLLISTQIAAALFVLVVSQFFGNSQLLFAKLIFNFQDRFALLNLSKAIILFCFMILPTLCLGATFPLVGKIFTQSVSTVGRSLGFAYTVNTIGAVLGSFSAGFLLIPLIGKEHGLSLVIGLQLLSSLLVAMIIFVKKREGMFKRPVLTLSALAGLLLCFYFPVWNRHMLSMGKYYNFSESASTIQGSGWLASLFSGSEILSKLIDPHQNELVYYGDGIGGFTSVLKYTEPIGTISYALNNSGKTDASTKGDLPTQTLLAHFGMLVHPDPKTIMVLGLASGVTAGEVLHYPVDKLDIVEISREVVRASDFFLPWNNNVLVNPKTNLIIQDGRAHLQLTKQKYDVIISEPSNPWMAGLAALFTQNFFKLGRDRLNDEGIFVQWIHSYQMDWPTFSLIGRTFTNVFPNSLLLTSGIQSDFLLVGFKDDNAVPSLERAEQRIQYARKSKNVTFTNAKILHRFMVSEDLPALFGDGELDSDARPRLEYAAPKVMYSNDPMIFENIQTKARVRPETQKMHQQIIHDLDEVINVVAYDISVNLPFRQIDLSGATPSQRERFFKLVDEHCSKNVIDYSTLTNEETRQRCLSAQIDTMNNNIDHLPEKSRSYFILAQLYRIKGNQNEASEYYSKSIRLNPDNAAAHEGLAVSYYKKGMVEKCIAEYHEAIRLAPNWIEPLKSLSWILATNQDRNIRNSAEAVSLAEQVNKQTSYTNPVLLDTLAAAYASAGRFSDAITAAEQALRILSQSADQGDMAKAIGNRLLLYKASKIYTEPLPKKQTPLR
jgi:spermidine synthase